MILARYAATLDRILGLGLDGVWDLKMLLDGNQVKDVVGVPRVSATGCTCIRVRCDHD
jgi:hypothetical protein